MEPRKDKYGIELKPGDFVLAADTSMCISVYMIMEFKPTTTILWDIYGNGTGNTRHNLGYVISIQKEYENGKLSDDLMRDCVKLGQQYAPMVVHTLPKAPPSNVRYIPVIPYGSQIVEFRESTSGAKYYGIGTILYKKKIGGNLCYHTRRHTAVVTGRVQYTIRQLKQLGLTPDSTLSVDEIDQVLGLTPMGLCYDDYERSNYDWQVTDDTAFKALLAANPNIEYDSMIQHGDTRYKVDFNA